MNVCVQVRAMQHIDGKPSYPWVGGRMEIVCYARQGSGGRYPPRHSWGIDSRFTGPGGVIDSHHFRISSGDFSKLKGCYNHEYNNMFVCTYVWVYIILHWYFIYSFIYVWMQIKKINVYAYEIKKNTTCKYLNSNNIQCVY